MVELTPELIKELASARNGFYSWDYVAGLAVWIIGVEAENERLREALIKLSRVANKPAYDIAQQALKEVKE